VPAVDGFTPEQQFFVAWGQFRGEAVRIETQRQIVKDDPHAVPRFRVIGPLSNLPEFEQAFACKPGAPMVRPLAQRCVVWSRAESLRLDVQERLGDVGDLIELAEVVELLGQCLPALLAHVAQVLRLVVASDVRLL
jgi:hypothetical protein